ncbi:MAG TPA: hypothetical protein VGE54_06010 [Brevundimonas sp.]
MFEVLALQPQTVQAAEICEVLAHPAAYDGKLISISGIFRTDWHHGAIIIGEPCGWGIVFGGNANLGEPWTRIEGTRGHHDVKISIAVIGRFRWNPDDASMYPLKHVIAVDAITSLEIQPE